jgi:hypothetical protein
MRFRHIGIAGVAAAVLATGCLSTGTESSDTTFDATTTHDFLARNFSNMGIVYDGLARIISAANGTQTNGVTFTNITGGVQGTVGYDLDHNGTMESSIHAKLIYNNPAQGINGGATFTVTSIDAPYLSGTATAVIGVSGGGSQVTISSGTADFTPTYGPHITIPEVQLTISPTLATPTVIGHANFDAGDDNGTVFFESAAGTGWRMRVTGSTFTTFTVP